VLYAPVDYYGSVAMIDNDARMLCRCDRVLVHCERLRRYFVPYAPVEYIDHHIKFAAPLRDQFQADGNLLWAGVRTNLPPLAAWVNAHPLPGPLELLTNFEDPVVPLWPAQFGFRRGVKVRLHNWSAELQLKMTASARAVIDIKAHDFRSHHKPPAKGIDFIASGVPLAMNHSSSTVEHLARMGFEVPSPLDTERWLSQAYWEETSRFGSALRELLSLERVARRFKRIVEEVLTERRGFATPTLEIGQMPACKTGPARL
jgi:hypothetical protein